MRLLKSFAIAFSMYSKIPMPQFKWESEDMKYSICFFPLIGLLIGAIMSVFYFVMHYIELPAETVIPLILVVIPIILTGGIHLDGFMDVSDALSSYQTREKKLEILKDPHIGAFAVIRVMVLAALFFAGLELIMYYAGSGISEIVVLGLGLCLSRCLSGISVVSFKCAKNEGTLYTFAEGSDKKKCLSILIKEAGVVMIAMIVIGRFTGAAAVLAALFTFLYYHVRSENEFGGITGDVAGWFVCICETCMVLVIGAMTYFYRWL